MVAVNEHRRDHRRDGSGDAEHEKWSQFPTGPDNVAAWESEARIRSTLLSGIVDLAALALLALVVTVFILALLLCAVSCILV